MTKIKSGSIKNSADQSNDNLPCKEIQTEEITYNDGENQCPDDYNKTVLKKRDENDENFDEILGLQNTQRFIEFINNAGPLIEEILSKGRQTIKKPTKTMELLNFILPDFLSEIDFSIGNCFITNESTYIVFLISLKGGKYSLVIEFMNEKANRYFLANTYLSQISLMENYLLGGTEEGTLLLWDLRMSELHCSQLETNQVIKKFKQSINRDLILRYPVFSTEFELNNTLSCISNYNHMAPIKQIYVNPDRLINNEIITLDQLNHLIFWNVIDLSYNETQRNYLQYGFNSKAKISQIMQINLSNIFLEEFISQQNIYNFNCFDIDLLDNHVFLSSNTQIIKLDKLGSTNVIPPKVYIGSDYDDCFPKIIKIMSINGFYGGFQDGRIGIFSKGYYIPKIWIDGFTNKAIINIFIMFLEVKIKDTKKKIKFFDNSKILALDAGSIIYVFDFSQDSKVNLIIKLL